MSLTCVCMQKLWLQKWRVCCLVLPIWRKSCELGVVRCGAGQSPRAGMAAGRSTAPGAFEAACKLLLICGTAPGCHGGPRHVGGSEVAGAGSRPRPTSTAVTCKRSCPQHGHKPVSRLDTRAMNACAHSSACKSGAGICGWYVKPFGFVSWPACLKECGRCDTAY